MANELLELDDVIRRVVAARVSDSHAVEDLVQETLVRVAAVEKRLDADELQAYAIVTARNLVISAARRHAVHQRHAHRLVDYTTLDGPEQLALDKDESRALAAALDQLDPDERDLLLRHEVDDVSTQQLGDELGLSAGGVAMRLARARARLRLDFVLAFRQLTLPTAHCRSILLAMSAGDHRRQRSLHAGEHLLTCPTCAQLAEPVTQRRRSIAGWLFVPAAEAGRLLWYRLRSNPAAQVATAVTVVAAVAATVVLLRPDDRTEARPAAPATTVPAPVDQVAAAPSPTTANTVATALAATVPATTAPAAAVVAAPAPAAPCPPNPLDTPDPAQSAGCAVPSVAVTAIDVATDEGFMAQTAQGQQLWVQLVGVGESPVDVDTAMQATIAGTITAATPDDGPSDERVRDMGWFVSVDYGDITVG